MIAVDAGVLAHAVNRHTPEHARAAQVVEALANGERPWVLPWPAVHEFLARVTHPHAVARALAPGEAWGFVAALAASPSLRLLGPGARHAAAVAETLALADAAGPGLPPGLEIAAVLREHGVRELLSPDRGMQRFRFLDVRDPLHGPPWRPDAPPLRRYRTLTRRPQ